MQESNVWWNSSMRFLVLVSNVSDTGRWNVWNWKNVLTIEVLKWIRVHLIFFPLSCWNAKTRGLRFEIVLFWEFMQFNIGKRDLSVTFATKSRKNIKEMADSLHWYTARITVIEDIGCLVFPFLKKPANPACETSHFVRCYSICVKHI